MVVFLGEINMSFQQQDYEHQQIREYVHLLCFLSHSHTHCVHPHSHLQVYQYGYLSCQIPQRSDGVLQFITESIFNYVVQAYLGCVT